MRTYYCHPVDPMRRFDPTLSWDDLQNNDYIVSDDDVDRVLSAIEEVESDWDSMTRNPQREVRVGTPGNPVTYETQDADLYRNRRNIKIWLDNKEIVPIDPTEDAIEIRSGRDNWRDITSGEGNDWTMNYEKGWIKIHRRLIRRIPSNTELFLRISYRHNGLGGNIHRPGQTTTTEQVNTGDTSFGVEDATRLPPQGVLFIGGDEYVRATVDYTADTVNVDSRAIRGTPEEQHSSGTTVHYCPMNVRKGVAAKAAVELLTYDDWVGQLVEGEHGVQGQMKVDQWESEWERQLKKYAEVRSP